MMFMKLLTGRAQIFADVRTYWSPEAVKKATGYDLEGVAKENGGFLHLINSEQLVWMHLVLLKTRTVTAL